MSTAWRRWVPVVGTLAMLALAIVALDHQLGAHSYHDISRLVRRLPRGQLGWALALTAAAYCILPLNDVMALRYAGRLAADRSIGVHRAGFAGVIAYGVSHLLGFPALTAGAVRYRFWTAWGLSPAEIARGGTFAGVTFTLGMVLVCGLALLLEPPGALRALDVPVVPARWVGAVLLGVVAAYVAWTVRAGGRPIRLPRAIARRVPQPDATGLDAPSPALALAQVAVALLDWTVAAAVPWVLLPESLRPGFLVFTGLFAVAQFAGLVSHVPAGLGVVESIVLAGLRGTVPANAAIAALLAYRLIYYVVPFCAVLLLLASYEARRRAGRLRALGSATRRSGAALGGALAPPAVATAVFLAGAVLLVSGATPSVHHRVAALHAIVPLGVIEASHLAGSVAGALLLVLAWALRRRLDAAWGVTVALLVVGIAASLLKGLDWEEALVLGAVLAIVVLFRRAFYRRAALTAEPFEPGWLVAVVAVLGVTTWIGLFSYRHVEYAGDLWWRVHPDADAPRFLRATLASAVALGMLALARLLRPARGAPDAPTAEGLARAARVAEASPDARAWLVLLGDKSLIFPGDAPVDGFIQYACVGRSWVALGDPVVAAAAGGPVAADAVARVRGSLAWSFANAADAHDGWPVFYEASAELLPLYVDLGLTLVKLGEEARVPLADRDLTRVAHKSLRHALRQVSQAGVTFEVLPREAVPALLPRLRTISDEWLARKHVREKGFSLGYFDDAYLAHFPVALVRDAAGEVVAFANVWPGGGHEELSCDLMRHAAGAPRGVMDYLFTQLMQWGKAEGYQWFNLGMAPLSGLEARQLAPLWSRAGAWLYRHGEHFYNYQGLRLYKEKFDPVWTPKYLAAPGGLALPRVLANVAALISGGIVGTVRR